MNRPPIRRVNFKMDAAEARLLEARAARLNTSLAAIIRRALAGDVQEERRRHEARMSRDIERV